MMTILKLCQNEDHPQQTLRKWGPKSI